MKNQYFAKISWSNTGEKFTDGKYSRAHQWKFDGNVDVLASSSPHVVPLPYSIENAVDPEEAFVASLSSCHMLWFLSIAAKSGFSVKSYNDEAAGIMAKNLEEKMAITLVTLQPHVTFTGAIKPNKNEIIAMHEQAHAECFIASSVKSEILCKPIFE